MEHDFEAVATVVVLVVVSTAIWAAYRVVRWFGRLLGGVTEYANGPRATRGGPDVQLRCRNAGCRSANPRHARFCRRCGTTVAPPVAVGFAAPPRQAPRRPPFAQAQPTRFW